MNPCPACGGAESRLEITAADFMLNLTETFHVRRCASCGLRFQNPVPSDETLARHYPDSYAPYAAPEMKLSAAARRELVRRRGYPPPEAERPPSFWGSFWNPFRARPWGRHAADTLLLPDFVPEGRLLEIACASGARLALLRRLGWSRCEGIEFSESAARAARARGFPVRTGKVEDVLESIPDASLDVVIAGFVMEHLENPFAVTRALAAKLKPGGQFLFSTLDIESPDFRMFGKYWYNLDLPRHLVFFRARDLRRLLSGQFGVERITRIAAPNDYVGSARYRARFGPASGSARFFSKGLDRLLLRAGNRIRPLCLLLAWCGLASRVALRCRRMP